MTLVPERREEVTTEGGLAIVGEPGQSAVRKAADSLGAAGLRTSLFVDPDPGTVRVAADLGVAAVELHTGEYANATGADQAAQLGRLLRDPARRAELAARGRARASGALSWERVADGFDLMYREVLGHA